MSTYGNVRLWGDTGENVGKWDIFTLQSGLQEKVRRLPNQLGIITEGPLSLWQSVNMLLRHSDLNNCVQTDRQAGWICYSS